MKKILLALISVLILNSSYGQNSTELKLNPVKNKTYRMSSATSQTVIQTINGNQQVIESETMYAISLKMMDATSDFIVAEVRYDSIFTRVNAMGKISLISSKSEGNMQSEDANEIMTAVYNRLSKNPAYVKIDFTGKVIAVVNQKMLAGIVLKDTALIKLTGPAGQAVKKQVASLTEEAALARIIETFTHNLPGKGVTKGDKWSLTSTINSGGMLLEITNNFGIESIAQASSVIATESVIKAAANALPMESGGARITYDDLKGLGKGTVTVDNSTGMLLEATSKTQISGTLGVSVQGMNLSMPMEISSSTKITSNQ